MKLTKENIAEKLKRDEIILDEAYIWLDSRKNINMNPSNNILQHYSNLMAPNSGLNLVTKNGEEIKMTEEKVEEKSLKEQIQKDVKIIKYILAVILFIIPIIIFGILHLFFRSEKDRKEYLLSIFMLQCGLWGNITAVIIISFITPLPSGIATLELFSIALIVSIVILIIHLSIILYIKFYLKYPDLDEWLFKEEI